MKRATHPHPRRQRITPAQLSIRAGDNVLVRLDSGIRMASTAMSEPFQWFGGVWMIKVEGIAGRIDLGRVEKVAG
jgi:hypothetical protein